MIVFYSWKDFRLVGGFPREIIWWTSQILKRKSTSHKMRYKWIITSKASVFVGWLRTEYKTGIQIYNKADAMAFKLRWM